MVAAVEWSSDLLAAAELKLFRRLGVFSGGFELAAAERVCGSSLDGNVLDGLMSLVEKSLVRSVHAADGSVRFAMLSSIRAYAAQSLDRLPDATDIKWAHAAYFADLAESADRGLRGHEQIGWLKKVELETDNLRLAMRWYLEQEEPDRVAGILWSLWIFWWNGAHFDEIRTWTEDVMSDPRRVADVNRARVLCIRGAAAFFMGEYPSSTAYLHAALPVFEDAGDKGGTAYALLPLGFSAPFRNAPGKPVLRWSEHCGSFIKSATIGEVLSACSPSAG